MRLASTIAVVLLAGALHADQPRETPVGVLLSATGTKLLRSGIETALAAKPGDIVFSGDAIRSETGSAAFLYCPASVSQSIGPSTEVLFDPKQMKVKSGQLGASQPVAACRLPTVVRIAAASQQHYGVTMVRSLQKAPEPQAVPKTALAAPVAAEIQRIGSGTDMQTVLARAAVYEQAGLNANALVEYRSVASQWPDATWVKGKVFELQEAIADAAAKASVSSGPQGQTYAVIVGISKYQKLPQDLWLQFAGSDATVFDKHLLSPRGGAVPPENITVLTDEKATTAALRNAFQTLRNRGLGKKDTFILLIAGHGTVEIPGSKSAFIVTYDSDPEDLSSTALPMGEVQEVLQTLSQSGRVIAFVDVCRSGVIGTIRNTGINSAIERLGESDGEMLGMMASRPKELSYEGPQFGGGHGAFTYYVLKALQGNADKNKDGIVNVNELIEYVREKVAEATADKQHPRDFGNIDNTAQLSDPRKSGIELAHQFAVIDIGSEPAYLASMAPSLPSPQLPAQKLDLAAFSDALASGRILPGQPDSAFSYLSRLETSLSPEQYTAQANQLRIALEDKAHQVLLKYLAGDERPQNKGDFLAAAAEVAAALELTPESVYLDARHSFFEGRALLYDRQYRRGADLLERCIRLDPNGAYAYNALGIAYLEQGDYARAIAAFRDSIRRAPHWAYPLHNLALAHYESGDYDAALARYRQAMRLRPDVSYLPYNMGLVYQKLNLVAEAEAAYRRASMLAPDSAEPLNALGALKIASGKPREAETFFRTALQKDPGSLAARYNLALVLSRNEPSRREAIELLRTNLAAAPEHVPSLLAEAEILDETGDLKGAVSAYETVLKVKPAYVGARIALADLYQRSGDRDAALREALAAAQVQSHDPALFERIGDLHAAAGRTAEAVAAYDNAINAAEGPARKRLKTKLRSLRASRAPSARL